MTISAMLYLTERSVELSLFILYTKTSLLAGLVFARVLLNNHF